MSAPRLYLVAYDIASPRRWRRVFKTLRRVGEHRQLSVFLCRLPPARMARLQARLRDLIDPEDDRLMVVDLGDAGSATDRLDVGSVARPTEQAWPLVI